MTNVMSPIAGAIYVNSTQLILSNSVFNNNSAYSSLAGAIYAVDSTVTISGSRFEDNVASSAAAIYAVRSTVLISSSAFLRNSATVDLGGAIVSSGGVLSITGSTFSANLATTHGGAIFASSTVLTMMSTIFSQNLAPAGYGSICITGSDSTLTNVTFDSNLCKLGGGAYFEAPARTSIISSVFRMNIASTDFGGGIFLNNGPAQISNSLFESNSAVSAGAVMSLRSAATFTNCDFTSNVALQFGGAILTIPPVSGAITGSNCRFEDNTATRGGALALQGTSSSFSSSRFSRNRAAFGAAAYLVESLGYQSTLTLLSSTLESGVASIIAGGIYLAPSSRLNILASTIRNNTAGLDNLGGAIYCNGSQVVITDTVVDSNSALSGGFMFAGANGFVPSDVVINGSSVFSNNVAATGGAIQIANSNLRSYGTLFFQNGATVYGGAIVAITPRELVLVGNNFTQNYLYPPPLTSVFGAGIFVVGYASGSSVRINDTIFLSNQVIAPTNSSNTFGGAAGMFCASLG
jgi:predicted outer membrane repeat protein